MGAALEQIGRERSLCLEVLGVARTAKRGALLSPGVPRKAFSEEVRHREELVRHTAGGHVTRGAGRGLWQRPRVRL